MWTLIISISCSVAVSILLKMARSKQIDVTQAIAFNYVMAGGLTLFLLRPDPLSLFNPSTPYWVIIALGILLPSIFLVMAKAVQQAGIVLSDAAQRLSLIIPLIAAVVLFGEAIQSSKLLGISLGLTALVCLSFGSKKASTGNTVTTTAQPFRWLIGVWLGFGVIDVLFKQLSKSGAGFSSSLLVTFILAGCLLFTWLFIKGTRWQQRSIFAGLFLGLLNFGNIYFYIRAHQQFPENPTLVFSTMNIGVITLGTLVGAGFFREKLSWLSVLGVILAISAIVALIP